MQFYLQASIVDKGVTVKQFKASRLDVIVGSFFTDIVAWFIVVVCAATLLYAHGMRQINVPSDAAEAMKPIAHRLCVTCCLRSVCSTPRFFAASILPLSTAYTVCEGLGFESGLDRTWKQAPVFYWLYTVLIVAGAAVVLIPNFPLVRMAILSQVLNGLLLPVVMYFMLRLVNNKELMGEHRNRLGFNVIAWITAILVTVLSLMWVWRMLHS